MLPQTILKREATQLFRNQWDDEDQLRNNEALRAYMVPLIVEVGDVIRRHARRLGADSGHGCAFQEDFLADAMAWQLVEFICRSDFDNEYRMDSTTIHQFTERHAAE